MADIPAIRESVLAFFRTHQRDLPWRRRRDAYAIWVSEIMLQQTRVATVIPYFERWLDRFPDVADLAAAELDDVLAMWSGLGYYSRARNLHRGAREAVESYGGTLPNTAAELRKIPGIGRYTAGAIASQAFGQRAAVVDGNVARVLARVFAIEESIKSTSGLKQLWSLAEELVDDREPGDFNQGLMELGATVCTPKNPSCLSCPIAEHCEAKAQGRQTQLPIVPKRKKASEKPEIRHQAVWVERRGAVLLARRKPKGLFGGLWEVPQATSVPELGTAIARDLELSADAPLMVHQQELSHRLLHIALYPATVSGRARRLPDESPYDQVKYQSLAQASKTGLSSATQTFIDAAQRTERWTNKTTPSSSSKKATTRS